MKKTLLLVVLSLSFYGTSQMTQANEPTTSDPLVTMFLCDSFTVNLEAETGASAVWDYTSLIAYDGQTRDVEVVDPATTTYASDFGSSTAAVSIGTNLTSYYSSTPTERSSQGFVFSEPSLGDVIAKFSTDNEIVATYPFAFGSSVTDAFAGDIDYLSTLSTSATGMGYASVDGEGTLNFPNAVSISNVLRYKLVDTSWATITLPIPLGNVEFIREQYEYYDYASSNLPIFIHSTITVQNVGAPTPISVQSLVLSAYAPAGYVGLDKVDNMEFSIYPNPATDIINISGDYAPETMVTVLDQSGRSVLSTNMNTNSIDISSLESGVYIVRFEDNGNVATKTIVKK